MSDYKTLADAQRLIIEKAVQVDENHLTQYIKSAIEAVERRGESLEDYALIKVQNPMQLKGGNSVRITSQWRLIRVDKLENVPVYDGEAATPNSFDDELDKILGNLTFIVGMAHVKASTGEIGSDEASVRTHREIAIAKAAIRTHRNAELEKLLERKKRYVIGLRWKHPETEEAIPVSAIKDLMKEK